jgi:2-haloalkanoic acid dehalogenase type II
MTAGTKSLSSFRLLSFDIYGTLLDWEGGLYEACSPLLSQLPKQPSRQELNSLFVKHEKPLQIEHPSMLYSTLLAETYTQVAASLGVLIPSPEEAASFAHSISTWPAWPDTIAAMQALGKHYKLVALSNVDRTSLVETVNGSLKGVKFDKLITAQDVGAYKPDHQMFEALFKTAQEEFGIDKAEILHVAQSLTHDHVPAKEVGLTSCWIERRGAEAGMGGNVEEVKDKVDFGWRVKTLGDLAELVEKEQR